MGPISHRIERRDLQPGDHIYSYRMAFTSARHGIYDGDGNVIYFARGLPHHSLVRCDGCTTGDSNNCVLKSCLDCFLDCGFLYRFQYEENPVMFLVKARGGTCTLAEPDPAEDVLYRANYLLLNGFGCHNIFRNNCEGFAMYCKTGLLIRDENGIGRSVQAATLLGLLLSSPMRSLITNNVGLLAASVGAYCLRRYTTDIGVRGDVAKVSVEELVARLRRFP